MLVQWIKSVGDTCAIWVCALKGNGTCHLSVNRAALQLTEPQQPECKQGFLSPSKQTHSTWRARPIRSSCLSSVLIYLKVLLNSCLMAADDSTLVQLFQWLSDHPASEAVFILWVQNQHALYLAMVQTFRGKISFIWNFILKLYWDKGYWYAHRKTSCPKIIYYSIVIDSNCILNVLTLKIHSSTLLLSSNYFPFQREKGCDPCIFLLRKMNFSAIKMI